MFYLSGLAQGTTFTPVSSTITMIFNKHRSLANGCLFACSSLGGVCVPMLYSFLLEVYTIRGTLIVFAGIWLNLIVVGTVLDPVIVAKLKRESLQQEDTRKTRRITRVNSEEDDKAETIEDKESLERENIQLEEIGKTEKIYTRGSLEKQNVTLEGHDNETFQKESEEPPDIENKQVVKEDSENQEVSLKEHDKESDKDGEQPDQQIKVKVNKGIPTDSNQKDEVKIRGKSQGFVNYGADIEVEFPQLEDKKIPSNSNRSENRHVNGSITSQRVEHSTNVNLQNGGQSIVRKDNGHLKTRIYILVKPFGSICRTGMFWGFVLFNIPCHVAYISTLVYLPAYGVELGMSIPQSSSLLSMIGGIELLSRIGYGYIGDKPWADRRVIITVSYWACGAGTLACSFYREVTMVYLYAATLSLLGGIHMVYTLPLYTEIIQSTHLAPAMGISQAVTGIVLSVTQLPLGKFL